MENSSKYQLESKQQRNRNNKEIEIVIVIRIEMKKYQLWLQRKSYSQHLNNLVKIKFEPLDLRNFNNTYTTFREANKKILYNRNHCQNDCNTTKNKQSTTKNGQGVDNKNDRKTDNKNDRKTDNKNDRKTDNKNDRKTDTTNHAKSNDKKWIKHDHTPLTLASSAQDLSYIITNRQLQHHKLRLMKSFEIIRDNNSMLKRIKEAKPYTKINKPKDYSNFKIKIRMNRQNQINSERLQNQNFKQYKILERKKATPYHKFILKLQITQISDLAHLSPTSSQVWLQVKCEKLHLKSQLISPSKLFQHQFQFPMEEDLLCDEFTVKICSCEFVFRKPVQEDYIVQHKFYSIDDRDHWLTSHLSYSRNKLKFWNLRSLKI